MPYYILDKDHKPRLVLDIYTWGQWRSDPNNVVVRQTEVYRHTVVSSVFLGMAPYEGYDTLFETMVFSSCTLDELNHSKILSKSWEGCLLQHIATVQKVLTHKSRCPDCSPIEG